MWRRYLLGLLVAMSLAGCAGVGAPSTPYTVVQQSGQALDAAAPAPSGEVLLSLSGRITKPNVAERLDLDEALLQSLQQVEYETYDGALRAQARYRGVLLSDVLQLAGAQQDATTLHAVALDQYETEIPLDAMKWPVMLALYRDDERITTRNKGPIQIVFPTNQDIDPQVWDPKWVWSVRSLEVR